MLSIDMIMPAAGIGKRMGSAVPKQYLKIFDQTVLEYTVKTLLASPYCNRVIGDSQGRSVFLHFDCGISSKSEDCGRRGGTR